MPKHTISVERVRELLDYDPASGLFHWKAKSARRTIVGSQAGYPEWNGYIRIGIGGRIYFAHVVAWLLVHGDWPKSQLDHINGNRADNRIENLREATARQNARNRKTRRDNIARLKGVCVRPCKTKPYQAVICEDGRRISLGYFETKEAAHAVYCTAASNLFAEFSRTE